MKVFSHYQSCPGAQDSVFFPAGFRMFFISDVIAFSKVTNPKYGTTVYLTYINITTI
jgi:hypothetical protein